MVKIRLIERELRGIFPNGVSESDKGVTSRKSPEMECRGKSSFCHMKFAFIPLLLLSISPLSAQDSGIEANKQLRATVQKWISIMKETQEKQKDWKEQKQILLDSKDSLQSENKQLETEILAGFARQEKLDTLSLEKIEEKKSYDDARETLREGLNDLDAKVSAVIPLLPETLKKEGKVEKAIADHKGFVIRNDKDKIALNSRLTAMITILIEAEKFNQVVTPFEGSTAEVGGQKLLLDGIYFGLAMGFAADPSGKVAIQMNPGSDGWTQTEITDPETIAKVRELIDVGKGAGEVSLVDLPLEIAK
ncbi:MAG: hypothetical protein ACJAVK_001353 [Akkermansiaceae bacterium]